MQACMQVLLSVNHCHVTAVALSHAQGDTCLCSLLLIIKMTMSIYKNPGVIGCLLGVATGPLDACVLCRQLFYCHPDLPSRYLPRSLPPYFIVCNDAGNICIQNVHPSWPWVSISAHVKSGKFSADVRKVLSRCQESSQKMIGNIHLCSQHFKRLSPERAHVVFKKCCL